MFYIAPNGVSNNVDPGATFFSAFSGNTFSAQVKVRNVSDTTDCTFWDSGNGSSNRCVFQVQGSTRLIRVGLISFQSFGTYPTDQDWHTLHVKCDNRDVEVYLDGVQAGSTWTAPAFGFGSNTLSRFLSNIFDTDYVGADIAILKLWSTAEDHDTATTADILDWNMQHVEDGLIYDSIAGPYAVASMDARDFFRWENSRWTGTKKVFAFTSFSNVPGDPFHVNNFSLTTGWDSYFALADGYVNVSGADGIYAHTPFFRPDDEFPILSWDSATEILEAEATGEWSVDRGVIHPTNWMNHMRTFIESNPTKEAIVYFGGPTQDESMQTLHYDSPTAWLFRMIRNAQYVMESCRGDLYYDRHRLGLHVDLLGGGGERPDVERGSIFEHFFRMLQSLGHPVGIEPSPWTGGASDHLFDMDSISAWAWYNGSNNREPIANLTGNVWVLADVGATSQIDTLAADSAVTHIIVHPADVAYALAAV